MSVNVFQKISNNDFFNNNLWHKYILPNSLIPNIIEENVKKPWNQNSPKIFKNNEGYNQ